MKTNITFKALQRGKVVRRTLSIEHPDYDIIPSETFNGYELPPISIESQVIDYLDSVDKSDIMAKYDWDIILDYYPAKQRISPMRGDEVADFIEYMRPLVESHPDLQMPIEAVICMAKDEMDFCIEDVFSWRGSYDEPCCALSNRTTTKEDNLEQLERLTKFSFYGWKGGYFNYTDNDTLHFESDYGSYTSGEYLIKFICANPTLIIEHIFG